MSGQHCITSVISIAVIVKAHAQAVCFCRVLCSLCPNRFFLFCASEKQSSPVFGDYSLLSDLISGQIKSLNTFVSGVKESSLCGSVWIEASDTVYLTYLPDSAADLHSLNNTTMSWCDTYYMANRWWLTKSVSFGDWNKVCSLLIHLFKPVLIMWINYSLDSSPYIMFFEAQCLHWEITAMIPSLQKHMDIII